MQRTDAIVVGAGQAGLAMSRASRARHRARRARARPRRRDAGAASAGTRCGCSTPELDEPAARPRYYGPDPDGFMARDEVVAMLERYARASRRRCSRARGACAGRGAARLSGRDRGRRLSWPAAVVVATGDCDRPLVPGFAAALPGDVVQVTPRRYRGRRSCRRAACWWSALGDRPAARRGDPRLGAAGDAGGRPAHAAAAPLPRPRHLRVAGAGWDPGESWRRVPDIAAARGSRRCSSRAAGGSTWRAGGGAACGSPAGSKAIDGARLVLGANLRRGLRASDARLRRVLGRIDVAIARLGDPGAGAIRRPGSTPGASGERPASLDLEAGASAAWSGRPATRGAIRG